MPVVAVAAAEYQEYSLPSKLFAYVRGTGIIFFLTGHMNTDISLFSCSLPPLPQQIHVGSRDYEHAARHPVSYVNFSHNSRIILVFFGLVDHFTCHVTNGSTKSKGKKEK